MAFNLTRMTVYALVCALEEDLKCIIKDYVGPEVTESILNIELISRAKNRIEKDIGILFEDLELKDLVSYFDVIIQTP